MSSPTMRGDRGASILASLVLVAMFGAAAIGVGSSNISTRSQLAATPTVLDDNGLRQGVQVKCGTGTVTVNYACKQTGAAEDVKKLQQKCSPGFSYKITEDKRTATVFIVPTPLIQGGCISAAPAQTCKSGEKAIPAIVGSFTRCSISYCLPGSDTCTLIGSAEDGKDLGIADKRVTGVLRSIQEAPTPAAAQKLLGAINGDDTLREAIEQKKTEADEAAVTAEEARIARDDALEGLEFCENDLTSSDCSKLETDAKKAEADAKAAQEKAAATQAEYKKLADARVALAPTQQGPSAGEVSPYVDCSGSDCIAVANGPKGLDALKKGGYTCGETESDGTTACQKGKIPPSQQLPGRDGLTGFGGSSNIGSLLKSLLGSNKQQPAAGNQTPQAPGTCAAGQLLCSGNTLYSRNNQCVDTVVRTCPNGCSGNACVQQGQNCPAAPVQPNPADCSAGTWKPTYSGACVKSWQCVPNGTTPDRLAAQISCQPQIADVGMSLSISYSCSAGTSVGSGFQTNSAQSGSATVTVASPPGNTNSATYGLRCDSQGQTASAQCTVQVGKPSIVLVANPKTVVASATAQLGWVTSGMQSCVISSPDLPTFTSQNASNTSVNGTVTTPPISSTTRFLLHCTTVGGGIRDATLTVDVKESAGVASLLVSRPTATSTATLGAKLEVVWAVKNAPAGSKVRLEIYKSSDAVTQGNNGQGIASVQPTSGTFLWDIPPVNAACSADSGIISCLTAGQYKIVAKLYTGSECWGFCGSVSPTRDVHVVAESPFFPITVP